MNNVPVNPNYFDSTTNKNTYTLALSEPLIYVEKVGEKWYYSSETIRNIDRLYKDVFPFGARIFKRLLPTKIQNQKILGLKAWQIFGIFSVLIIGFILYGILNRLTHFIFGQINKKERFKNAAFKDKLERFINTLTLFILIFIISKFLPSLQFSPVASQYLIKSFYILLIFIGAFTVVRLLEYLLQYFTNYIEDTSSKLDDQLLPVVKKVFKLLIWVIAISMALKQLNVNLTAIIAGLSIGGLALALASQDTVKNLIGSVTIFIDHPFEIDDYIVLPGTEGTVEEVGMRATRLRTPGQSIAYIPNGELSNMIIDNLGLRIYRRWNLTIGVEYGTSAATIEEFCNRAKTEINHFDFVVNDKTLVRLNELGASSINIFAMIFINVKTYNEELECKHKILIQLIDLAKEMNVEFAFPTQTLHLKKD